MPTVAILPIRSLDHAKTRLSDALTPGPRRALVEAMFADVLTALRRCEQVGRTVVVTSDHGAQRIAGGHGADVVEDGGSGHSEAAQVGIALAVEEGFDRALLVPGDCPLLSVADLDALLAHARAPRSVAIVPDRHGAGTNALLLCPPDAMAPAFGDGSRGRHVRIAAESGAEPEIVEIPSLALDIDTPDDLAALKQTLAATRGGAAHTRGMLSQLQRSRA